MQHLPSTQNMCRKDQSDRGEACRHNQIQLSTLIDQTAFVHCSVCISNNVQHQHARNINSSINKWINIQHTFNRLISCVRMSSINLWYHSISKLCCSMLWHCWLLVGWLGNTACNKLQQFPKVPFLGPYLTRRTLKILWGSLKSSKPDTVSYNRRTPYFVTFQQSPAADTCLFQYFSKAQTPLWKNLFLVFQSAIGHAYNVLIINKFVFSQVFLHTRSLSLLNLENYDRMDDGEVQPEWLLFVF